MRTATCRSCQRLFTTRREDDEHCPRCQPRLPGLAPEQRPLFPEAALGGRFATAGEAAQETAPAGAADTSRRDK